MILCLLDVRFCFRRILAAFDAAYYRALSGQELGTGTGYSYFDVEVIRLFIYKGVFRINRNFYRIVHKNMVFYKSGQLPQER